MGKGQAQQRQEKPEEHVANRFAARWDVWGRRVTQVRRKGRAPRGGRGGLPAKVPPTRNRAWPLSPSRERVS